VEVETDETRSKYDCQIVTMLIKKHRIHATRPFFPEIRMRLNLTCMLLFVLLAVLPSCGHAFTAPDVCYIRVFLDRSGPLAEELSGKFPVTGAGPGSLDLVVPLKEFPVIEHRLPAYEILYADEEARIAAAFGHNDLDAFHEYDDMVAELIQAAADYPSIVRLDTLGLSVEGRLILGARVTDNPGTEENEPEFRVLGLHHGNELMSAEIPLKLLALLTEGYGVDPAVTSLVDTVETWIVPMVNPDGRMATPFPSRYNANGVDLNRDYGYMWAAQGSSPGYFSQPETRAVRENGLENTFCLSLSFHTSGDIVNAVWNYKGGRPDDWDLIWPLTQEYASFNGYWAVGGYDWYQVYGDTNDWSYGSRSDFDWTIEVADSNIETVWSKNKDAILTLMGHCWDGIHGTVTDIDTGEPLEALVTVLPDRIAWYTDPAAGDYHRLLPPGTYDLTFSSPGYADSTIYGIVVTDGDPAILDAALRPTSGTWSIHVAACHLDDPYSYPNHYQRNPTDAADALGPPDERSVSLGEGGWIVLDFGALRPIFNGEGYDFTVFETAPADGYTVYAGNEFRGPWTMVGTGDGTTEFDLDYGGLSMARYIRILDENDGDPYEWYPGCDIDAVSSSPPPDTIILGYAAHEVDDTGSGNGNGRADPGETFDLTVTLENSGTLDATGISATLSTEDPLVTVLAGTTLYPDIPRGGSATQTTPFTLAVDAGFPEGTSAELAMDLLWEGGGGAVTFSLTVGRKPLLLVDDDDGEAMEGYLQYSLDGAGMEYDLWDVVAQGSPDGDVLNAYSIVLWTTGDDYSGTLTTQDKANLGAYLDDGGSLLLSSQDYLWENGIDSFAENYLHVGGYDSDVGVSRIAGIDGDPISDGLDFTLDFPAGLSNYSDDIQPAADAFPVFLNSAYKTDEGSDVDEYGVIRFADAGDGGFRTVFFAVPFEAVPRGAGSIELMTKTLEWLSTEPPGISITLAPESTTIPQGGILELDVTVGNSGSAAETVTIWTAVLLPGGGVYPPSGYLAGPVTTTLDPQEVVTGPLSHPVPAPAPTGFYTYGGFVAAAGDTVAVDEFEFEIISAVR